ACYVAAIERIDRVAGLTFNIGGGPRHTQSLLEFLEYLGRLSGRRVRYGFADWRPGDQQVYVSNIDKARASLGWEPRIGVTEGIERLYRWVEENSSLLGQAIGPR